jgi:hypothetical protein
MGNNNENEEDNNKKIIKNNNSAACGSSAKSLGVGSLQEPAVASKVTAAYNLERDAADRLQQQQQQVDGLRAERWDLCCIFREKPGELKRDLPVLQEYIKAGKVRIRAGNTSKAMDGYVYRPSFGRGGIKIEVDHNFDLVVDRRDNLATVGIHDMDHR